VDVSAAFVPHAKAAKLMQPRQRTLDHPSIGTQPTAMSDTAAGQHRLDAQLHERITMRIRMIRPIALYTIRPAARAPRLTGDRRNGLHQRQQLGYVVPVRASECRGERNAIRIGDDVVLRAAFPAIRGVGAGLLPPKTARTEALSTTARDQSILSASRNRLSNTWCTSCQTPASCHSCSRRQQVMPHPHPSSCGKSSQGMPVLSTNRMPVNVRRWSIGFRPPLGRGLAGGRQGSMTSQSSSVSSGLAIGSSSMTTKESRSLRTHRLAGSSNMTFC